MRIERFLAAKFLIPCGGLNKRIPIFRKTYDSINC